MKSVLKKQIEEMPEGEIRETLRREYLRRLVRYRMTDDFFKKKYEMDFENFEKKEIVKKKNFSFEVESDSQEWELSIQGIKEVLKKLKELSDEDIS
ncbi:MAG: hypothetical protein HZA01_00135 [Nitrospinae bacterium]|nr:hypothetical protein [Nitrospinota bacterium]